MKNPRVNFLHLNPDRRISCPADNEAKLTTEVKGTGWKPQYIFCRKKTSVVTFSFEVAVEIVKGKKLHK